MKRKKQQDVNQERTFDKGTHPGAYTEIYDENNELLDTVDSADDEITEKIRQNGKRANSASPAAADPPVPNRAHTEM